MLGTVRRGQGGRALARFTPPPTIACDMAACERAIASLQVGSTGTKVGILVQRVLGTGRHARLRFARRIALGFHRPGRFRVRRPRLADGAQRLRPSTLAAAAIAGAAAALTRGIG